MTGRGAAARGAGVRRGCRVSILPPAVPGWQRVDPSSSQGTTPDRGSGDEGVLPSTGSVRRNAGLSIGKNGACRLVIVAESPEPACPEFAEGSKGRNRDPHPRFDLFDNDYDEDYDKDARWFFVVIFIAILIVTGRCRCVNGVRRR